MNRSAPPHSAASPRTASSVASANPREDPSTLRRQHSIPCPRLHSSAARDDDGRRYSCRRLDCPFERGIHASTNHHSSFRMEGAQPTVGRAELRNVHTIPVGVFSRASGNVRGEHGPVDETITGDATVEHANGCPQRRFLTGGLRSLISGPPLSEPPPYSMFQTASRFVHSQRDGSASHGGAPPLGPVESDSILPPAAHRWPVRWPS